MCWTQTGSSWTYNETFQVKGRVEKWKNLPSNKVCERPLFQLEWEAEVVEYVTLLWNAIRCRSPRSTATKSLSYDIPIIGPRFVPPSYLHSQLRPGSVNVKPETRYLKPINIIHPMYYPELASCPQCGSHDRVTWEGWTTTGARELYGVAQEETALGLQMRCENCKQNRGMASSAGGECGHNQSEPHSQAGSNDVPVQVETVTDHTERPVTDSEGRPDDKDSQAGYCFALTSQAFWKKWNHWQIPGTIIVHHLITGS